MYRHNHMIASKLNYLIERTTIIFVCLWGNWALYYWLMVLIFDASFTTLKLFSPLLLLQISASLVFFLRIDLGFASSCSRLVSPAKWLSTGNSGKRFYFLSLTALILAAGVVGAVHHYKLTSSSLTYNTVWVLLLPISLFYLFYFKSSTGESSLQDAVTEPEAPVLDIVLLLICTAALAFSLYGTNWPSFDDGFYAGVISSTLASPDLPIQGRDFLLNTDAPFTLHPAYRTVGYEVLIAFLSDLTGADPLHLYFDIFPTVSIIFWSVAAYLFMRTLGVPYPGFAVIVALVVLLFWNKNHTPGQVLAVLCWGKHLLCLVGAPLLFVFVSVFIRSPSVSTWLLLLLSVSSAGIWSNSALFVVPMSVAFAGMVFLSPIKTNLRTAFYVLLSIAPIFLLAKYTIMTLSQMSGGVVEDVSLVEWGGSRRDLILQAQLFGGRSMHVLQLVLLILLPLLVRTTGSTTFQVNIYKICMVGIFTVMAPYVIEVISIITSTQVLMPRLYWSYPTVLLVGVLGSIVLSNVMSSGREPGDTRARYAVIAVALVFYCTFFGITGNTFLFGEGRLFAKALFTSDFEEARAARALIPDGSFVAAGDMDDILPIFPHPPSFIEVKSSYLQVHRHFLSAEEFKARRELFLILQNRLPREGENLESSLDWIISTANDLEVTSIVFQSVGGRHRHNPFFKYKVELDPEREVFVKALSARLSRSGYECTATPSGRSTVCNTKPGDSLESQAHIDALKSNLPIL